MAKRINYSKGDLVGISIFISELKPINKRHKRGLFKCECGNEFETTMECARRGYSCGCKKKYFENRYKYGDKIGDMGCTFVGHVKFNIGRKKSIFKCKCGVEFIDYLGDVKLNKKKCCTNCITINRHGKSSTNEYMIYYAMKSRTLNKNSNKYEIYGGRGIFMSDDWLESFQNFYRDMGDRPSKRHSIERIDSNKGYCKENCKWATYEEQNSNTSRNIKLTFNGETKTCAEWSRVLNINSSVLSARIKRGLSIENVLDTSKKRNCKKK